MSDNHGLEAVAAVIDTTTAYDVYLEAMNKRDPPWIKKTRDDWERVAVHCERCGGTFDVMMPLPVAAYARALRRFIKTHFDEKGCTDG